MSGLKYAIRDGWRLVVRHKGMSTLTLFTAITLFFLIGASTLFALNVRSMVSALENQLTIRAYLKDGAVAAPLLKKIRAMAEVSDARHITKDMALEQLHARIGNQAKAITLLGENPLPDSIEVNVKNASLIEMVAERLLSSAEVEDVVYAGIVAKKLTRISDFAGRFSVIMLLAAVIASGIVLFNTVKISVYSKEEEIGVMVMVGATAAYITLPFVIQGFILGLTGTACAAALLGITYRSAVARLKDMLPFLPFLDSPQLMYRLAFMLVCCGATVSLLASLLAVEKFIRKASKPL